MRLAVLEEAGERSGVEPVVTEKPIDPALPLIGSAAGDDVQDAARCGAKLRRRVIRNDLKLLNPILRNRGRLRAVVLPLVGGAVDEDSIGKAPLPVDRNCAPYSRIFARRNPWREKRQIVEIPLHRGKLVDILFLDDRVQRISRGFENRRLGDDGDRFLDATDLEDEIDCDFLPHAQDQPASALGGETGELRAQLIAPRLKIRHEVLTQVPRRDGAGCVRGNLQSRDGGSGQHGALLIGHPPAKRCGRGLGSTLRRHEESCKSDA